MWFKSECDKISDRVWDYSAQRLSVSERAQVENHLQQCAKCQAEAEAYRQTVGMLGMARNLSVPESQTTWRDLRSQLSPARPAVTRSTDWLPRLTLAGAGTAMAATLLVVFLSNGRHPNSMITPPASSNSAQQNVSSTPVEVTTPNDTVAQNDTPESTDKVTSGPTVGSFAKGAFVQLPAPHGHPAAPPKLAAASLERLARSRRREYVRNSHRESGVGHTKLSTPSLEALAQSDSGTTRGQHYVLPPVSSSSDDETMRRYVISSIPAAQGVTAAVASNDGADEGRAW